MKQPGLGALLREACGAELDPQSEMQLAEFVEAGRLAWPKLDLELPAIIDRLAARLPVDIDDASLRSSLEMIESTDLYLVIGCELGDREALRELEALLRHHVPHYVSVIDASPAFADEVTQELRRKLLIGGARPKLTSYSGRGPFGAWLRAVAVRTAQNLRRRAPRELAARDLIDATPVSPEAEYLRAVQLRQFRRALHGVLAGRPLAERELLRLHYVEGKNIDEIGALTHVHRATVARRLSRVRDAILAATRDALQREFEEADLDEVIEVGVEEVAVSLSRILTTSSAEDSNDGHR
jgi:RNA polymerase sigma-70 factor (ECF subfamily)